MKRKCTPIIKSKDGKRAIYIDDENKSSILAYLNQDDRYKKKFQFISEIILGGYKNPEVYDKESINADCKDVTAMKFFKGQENGRIYCKQINTADGVLIIVAAVLHERKKSQKNTQVEKNLIKKVGGYQYEL
jgi:hypothetical protein